MARVAQQGGVDLNLVLANTKGTAQAGSSYQADANLRVGQVIAAGNVTLQAGQSILNAGGGPAPIRQRHAQRTERAGAAALGYAREVVLIAGSPSASWARTCRRTGRPCWSICRPAIVRPC